MERHNGQLKVESSPGHGTTFVVLLSTDIKTIDE
jgi:signal transduction histidine kinase